MNQAKSVHNKSIIKSKKAKEDDNKLLIYPHKLQKRCEASIEDYHAEGQVIDTPDGVLIYQDNGADVLAIVHLDTVLDSGLFEKVTIDGKTILFNACLDDRLGAYMVLDMLPKMGITVDVLLTEGEEIGRSTAAHFELPGDKVYNWQFSFDRAGTDVVMYDYEEPEYRTMLEDLDIKVGFGSFSDLCFTQHLNVKGFNFGTGYYDAHRAMSYMIFGDTFKMLRQFEKFYNKYHDSYMPHEEVAYSSYGQWYDPKYSYDSNTDKWSHYYDEAHSRYYEIELMKGEQTQANGSRFQKYCPACLQALTDCYGICECLQCNQTLHNDFAIFDTGICLDCHGDNGTIHTVLGSQGQ